MKKIKYVRNAKKKKSKRKILSIILIIAVLYNVVYLLNTSFTERNYMSFFGTSFFRMDDNNMKNDLRKNDLVIVKKVKDYDLEVNDIIAYTANNEEKIAKVYKILHEQNIEGKEYVTKFNNAMYPNPEHLSKDEIIGKKVAAIPILGLVMSILQARITTIIILVIIVYLLMNVYYTERKNMQRDRKKNSLT